MDLRCLHGPDGLCPKINSKDLCLPRIPAPQLHIGARDVLVDPEVRVGELLRETRRRRSVDIGGLNEGLRADYSTGPVVADLNQEVREHVFTFP